MLIQIALQLLKVEKKYAAQKIVLLALCFSIPFLFALEALVQNQDSLYGEIRIIFSLGIFVLFFSSFFSSTLQKNLSIINQSIIYIYSAMLIFLTYIHDFSFYNASLLLSGVIIFSLYFGEIKQLIIYQCSIFILIIQASLLTTNLQIDIYIFFLFYVFVQFIIVFIQYNMIKHKQMIREMNERIVLASTLLQSSNKALEQFASITSHDLKEPIRTVNSYLQLIKKNIKDQKYQSANEFIDIALASNKRMQKMVEGILKYAKIGSHQVDFLEVDFNAVLAQACSNLKTVIEENNCSFKIGDIDKIYGDESLCIQLMQNLIQNAIKYKSEKIPLITITAKRHNQECIICISDNGRGIPEECIQKIFEIFQRVQGNEEDGTGIGLATCKKIVEIQNGQIWVESKVGFGSDFYIALPLIE